jgi:copper(I)-binding protein
MKQSRFTNILPILISCFLCSAGIADELKIEKAWIQSVPPTADATAAYMTIRNTGTQPFVLIGGSSPIAKEIQPMVTTRVKQNGKEILGMGSVDKLEIEPGATLVLKPGGNHLMLMDLLSHPKEGERVKLTIRFDPGNKAIDLDVPIYKQAP